MPQFVILTHDWPFLHWDLMLEFEGKLLTWRLLDEPRLAASLRIEKSSDHRLKYLDYTGPVDGDRGTVDRWDNGLLLSLMFNETQTIAEIQSRRFGEIVTVILEGQCAEFVSRPNITLDTA